MVCDSRVRFRPKHLWKISCFTLGLASICSFVIVGHLKYTGEVMPFCFYDNFYYGAYYFTLFLYTFVAIELSELPINKSQVRNWYTHKFFGCSMVLTEVEALLQFIANYDRLSYELEIDIVAGPYIFALVALGIGRLILLLLMAYFAIGKLNRTIAYKSYNAEHFGSMITFVADYTIIQLYLYTAYIYDFNLPLVLLISCVAYAYYKYVRI